MLKEIISYKYLFVGNVDVTHGYKPVLIGVDGDLYNELGQNQCNTQ